MRVFLNFLFCAIMVLRKEYDLIEELDTMADTKKIKSRKIKGFSTKEEVVANMDTIEIEEKNDVKAYKIKEGVTKVKSRKIQKGASSEKTTKKTVQNSKKVKSRKIRMSFTTKEEQQMDRQMEKEDNLSVVVMIIILVLCFVVGISLGYVLYRIAINSSNVMFIVKYLVN